MQTAKHRRFQRTRRAGQNVAFLEDFTRNATLLGSSPTVGDGSTWAKTGTDNIETITSLNCRDLSDNQITVNGVCQGEINVPASGVFAGNYTVLTPVDWSRPWVAWVDLFSRVNSGHMLWGPFAYVDLWYTDANNYFRLHSHVPASGSYQRKLISRSMVAGADDRNDHVFTLPSRVDTDFLTPCRAEYDGTDIKVYLEENLIYTHSSPSPPSISTILHLGISESGNDGGYRARGMSRILVKQ